MENNETSEFDKDNSLQAKPLEEQDILLEKIIHVFAPIYAPGERNLYAGDNDEDFIHFDEEGCAELGLIIDPHAHLSNVVIHHIAKNRLMLIEAVTSHGPINDQRKDELIHLFGNSRAELVFITALLARSDLEEYFEGIAWETIIWMADCPTHFIYLNGGQLLGPYEEKR